MNQLPNIKSISKLSKVEYNNVIPGKYYVIKYNPFGENMMDYIGKCTSTGNFSIIYSRKRKDFNKNYEKWIPVELNIILNKNNDESSIHQLPSNSPIRSLEVIKNKPLNQPRVQNSINITNPNVNLLKFKEMLTCKRCNERTVNQVLKCGHTLCKSCVDQLCHGKNNAVFNCPICNKSLYKPYDVKNLYFN